MEMESELKSGSSVTRKPTDLPNEILYTIVSHLNQHNTTKFCLINKQCYDIGKQKLQKNLFIGSRQWKCRGSSYKFYNTYTVVEFDTFFRLLRKGYWNSNYLKKIVFIQPTVGTRFYKDFSKYFPKTELITDSKIPIIPNLNSKINGVTTLQVNVDNKVDYSNITSIQNLEIDLLNQACENLPSLIAKYHRLKTLSLKNCTKFTPNPSVILDIPNLVIDSIITDAISRVFLWDHVKSLYFQSSRYYDSFRKTLNNIEEISIDCFKQSIQQDFFVEIPSQKLRYVCLKGRALDLKEEMIKINDIDGIETLVLQEKKDIFWGDLTATLSGDFHKSINYGTGASTNQFSREQGVHFSTFGNSNSGLDHVTKPLVEYLHSQYKFPDLTFIHAYQKVFKIEKFYGEFVDCEEIKLKI